MATDWSGAPRARGGSQAVLRLLIDSAANACRCLPHRSECCHTSLSLRGLRSTLRCTQVCVTIELLLVRRLRRAVKFAHRQSVGGKRKGDASESMQESLLSDAGTDGSSKAKAAEGTAAKGSRKASIAKLLWLQVPDIPYVRALLCFVPPLHANCQSDGLPHCCLHRYLLFAFVNLLCAAVANAAIPHFIGNVIPDSRTCSGDSAVMPTCA